MQSVCTYCWCTHPRHAWPNKAVRSIQIHAWLQIPRGSASHRSSRPGGHSTRECVMPAETIRTSLLDQPAFRLTAGIIFRDRHGPGNNTRIWLNLLKKPLNPVCNDVGMRRIESLHVPHYSHSVRPTSSEGRTAQCCTSQYDGKETMTQWRPSTVRGVRNDERGPRKRCHAKEKSVVELIDTVSAVTLLR